MKIKEDLAPKRSANSGYSLGIPLWNADDGRVEWLRLDFTENSDFHAANCTRALMHSAHCGNYENSLSRIFGKKFVKEKVLINKLLKS